MVTVDLITGFLGAGKTTFILRYLHFLQKQGLRVKMIENEFGDVSIDSQLLASGIVLLSKTQNLTKEEVLVVIGQQLREREIREIFRSNRKELPQ